MSLIDKIRNFFRIRKSKNYSTNSNGDGLYYYDSSTTSDFNYHHHESPEDNSENYSDSTYDSSFDSGDSGGDSSGDSGGDGGGSSDQINCSQPFSENTNAQHGIGATAGGHS